MEIQKRHLIFSDESGWESHNQFGSLAKVSGSYENSKNLNSTLKKILYKYGKKEIKFKEINGYTSKMVAKEFLDVGFEFLIDSRIKVHILVWDKHDSRHNIPNRCDIENMKRMYYHNMKSVLNDWKIETTWEFYPDEFTPINWEYDVTLYVENTRLRKKNDNDLLLFDLFEPNSFPVFNTSKELCSTYYPIIQLADLYAGLARTSRKESSKFIEFFNFKENENLISIFENSSQTKISNSMLPKFEVMYHFKKEADKLKMGINLSKQKYFKTFHSRKNISISHYTPQGEYDKAPTKRKSN